MLKADLFKLIHSFDLNKNQYSSLILICQFRRFQSESPLLKVDLGQIFRLGFGDMQLPAQPGQWKAIDQHNP